MSKYSTAPTPHLERCLETFSKFEMLAPTCKKIRKELKRRAKA